VRSLGQCPDARAQSVSDGFNPTFDGGVYAIALHRDGTIVVGGEFANVDGLERSHVARLHLDGTVEDNRVVAWPG
jgi:hypothetical protein